MKTVEHAVEVAITTGTVVFASVVCVGMAIGYVVVGTQRAIARMRKGSPLRS